jgi:hypothetical protein
VSAAGTRLSRAREGGGDWPRGSARLWDAPQLSSAMSGDTDTEAGRPPGSYTSLAVIARADGVIRIGCRAAGKLGKRSQLPSGLSPCSTSSLPSDS